MNIEEAIHQLKNHKAEIDEKYINARYSKAIETLLIAYEKEKEKNKKAIDFINDEKNYFEDGENWQNVLKIKEILENKSFAIAFRKGVDK